MTNRQNGLRDMHDTLHMIAWKCITEWGAVDEELFQIFRSCIGPYEQSAIIYFGTPEQKVRLGLTDELVLSVLPEKERGHDHASVRAWKEATADFDDLLDVRRRMSHLPIFPRKVLRDGAVVGQMGFDTATLGSGGISTSWSEKYESPHEQIRSEGGGQSPLTLGELQDHLTAVHALGGRLRAFLRDALSSYAKADVTSSGGAG